METPGLHDSPAKEFTALPISQIAEKPFSPKAAQCMLNAPKAYFKAYKVTVAFFDLQHWLPEQKAAVFTVAPWLCSVI